MNLEDELRKKSFTPSRFEQNTGAGSDPKTLIDIEDVLVLTKQLTEAMAKVEVENIELHVALFDIENRLKNEMIASEQYQSKIEMLEATIKANEILNEESISENTKKTINEWEKETGIRILDPDGFDRTDQHLYERLMSKDEFLLGMGRSTLINATKLPFFSGGTIPPTFKNNIIQTKEMIIK